MTDARTNDLESLPTRMRKAADELESLGENGHFNAWCAVLQALGPLHHIDGASAIQRAVLEINALKDDARRWRTFEKAGHLMITDFDKRTSGTFSSTKRSTIDALLTALRQTQGE